MTKKLYDEFPYETEFTATVESCSENSDGTYNAVLDRTLFFPEEGGQSPDKGVMISDGQEINVLDVQIKEGTITHKVQKALAEGSSISGKVNWEHRFSNMQQHTGEHIFSGIVNSRFGFNNVGFHLSDNEVTMDYNGVLSKEDLLSVEHAANEAVIKNIDVKAGYPSKEEISKLNYRSKKEIKGAVRIVEVPGYDICACCAPHVRKTGEIGVIKVINSISYKGGTRVWILCGFRAIREFNKVQDACAVVSGEYSVPVSAEDFSSAIEKRNKNQEILVGRLRASQTELLSLKAGRLESGSQNAVIFVKQVEDGVKRALLNELVKDHSGYSAVFDGDDDTGYSFIIASLNLNCNEAVSILKEKFGARGGGKPVMVQGSVNAKRAEIEKIFQ